MYCCFFITSDIHIFIFYTSLWFQSHPACRGADTAKSVFNIYGQSPLVAHFMRVKNLTREAGQSFLVQRTEQENLPPYPFDIINVHVYMCHKS